MPGSQAHFIAQVRLSATCRTPLYRSGPCALAASGKRRDIAIGIAVHPGDIVSPDDNGVMVMPKATSGAVMKIAAARDEKETGVIRHPWTEATFPSFRDETPGTEAGRAPFRADGTGKRELVVMKGGRTVSSGKSIAPYPASPHRRKNRRPRHPVGWRACCRKRARRKAVPAFLSSGGRKRLDQIIQQTRFTAEDQLDAWDRTHRRALQFQCGLGKSTPRRAQPEDRSAAGNLADARGQRRFGPSHQPQVAP